MEKYIPEDLRPKENTSIESLVVVDNQTKDAGDSRKIENRKRLSAALKQAILAKGHGLYLSSQTTKQRTAATIQIVRIQHVTPVIQNRGLANRLLQQLHLKSDIQFFFLA